MNTIRESILLAREEIHEVEGMLDNNLRPTLARHNNILSTSKEFKDLLRPVYHT